MTRPSDGISKACKKAFWCAKINFAKVFVDCLECRADTCETRYALYAGGKRYIMACVHI